MNTFLYAYIILFPGMLSAVSILLESMKKISCFLGHYFTFFSGKVVQVSPSFTSVLLQIELNTLKFQSIQNNTFMTKNQESKPIFAIFLYLKLWLIYVKHAVCQGPQLYSYDLCHILEAVFQFLYPKRYMQQKCSPCTHLKPFSISPLHLKHDCGHLHGH